MPSSTTSICSLIVNKLRDRNIKDGLLGTPSNAT